MTKTVWVDLEETGIAQLLDGEGGGGRQETGV
jgi:hypothetical protein